MCSSPGLLRCYRQILEGHSCAISTFGVRVAHSRCSAMNFMNEYTEGREEGKEGRREGGRNLVD